MTASFLQDALIKDLQDEFTGYKLVNQKGKLANFNIYPEALPEKKEENDENHFPFIIVKVINGKSADIEDDETVTVLFIIGIYDDNENRQGNIEILNIIEKYKNHLIHNKFIDGFEFAHPYEWTIQDEETYPFYYGGIETRWKLKKIEQKEDEYI